MAARLRPKHQDEIRDKIKASQLLNFLTQFALSGKDTGGQDVNPARVTAALGLLKKCVPDLTSVEHSGEVAQSFVARTPEVAKNTEQWQQQHSPEQTIQ